MSVVKRVGQNGRVAIYEVPDTELAVGSTLGGPKVAAIVKANGAISKVYSVDLGVTLVGTMILRHYDEVTGMHLAQNHPGTFIIHPEHQEHVFNLANHVAVHETIFVLSGEPQDQESTDPPGVYYNIELRNDADEAVQIATYAYAVLRGETEHDVLTTYDKRLGAMVAWNKSKPEQARVFGCSDQPESFETTLDHAQAVSEEMPGPLSRKTDAPLDPLGVLHHRHCLEPGETVQFSYLLSLGAGREEAVRNYRSCPPAQEALDRTKEHYHRLLSRSIVVTPDPYVNRGVLWAKANMLRVETRAPTGWCFTNDPTRSNNSVGRDTAWFGFGADYFTPEFVRESLLSYVRLQEKSGMIVEYYDIRNGKTADYGLNINDNTPLLILALWHHYNNTGDIDFLREVYPAAVKAGRYILSQRNDQGLVWCTATGTSDWGIVGWRNVIPNYRLSGATTEVNSECFAALRTLVQMSRVLDRHEESAEFTREADSLKTAINTHLWNKDTDLYYLNIDLNGNAHSDVTSDLVFPVMFGVASSRTASHIISRLSNHDFWTEAGIRTAPRDAPDYTPEGGWGLLGGVWVGVSFWYAFAAAQHAPEFMAHALSASFRTYSRDPRRHNTVPGQFSEWLNGETLVNQGMMLSPWYPPRYLWAAIEGVAGVQIVDGALTVSPRLASDWKWLGVQNLQFRGMSLTWFAVRAPELRIYTNFRFPGAFAPYLDYEHDITDQVRVTGDSICAMGLRQGPNLLLFAGNTDERTVSTAIRIAGNLTGAFRLCSYNSQLAEWEKSDELIPADQLSHGITMQIERKGFVVLDLRQEL